MRKSLIILFFAINMGLVMHSMQEHIDLPPVRDVTVATYFLPGDEKNIARRLLSFINSAEKRVYVAVYWITYEPVVDALIEMKRRGIDVRLIYDISSPKAIELATKCVSEGLIPLVAPFKDYSKGLMHHKFVVVDDDRLWTGSANFTGVVLDPNSTETQNNENVLRINSRAITDRFKATFETMEEEIIEWYMDHVAKNKPEDYDWESATLKVIKIWHPRFQEIYNAHVSKYNAEERRRLDAFLQAQAATQSRKRTFPDTSSDSSSYESEESMDDEGAQMSDTQRRILRGAGDYGEYTYSEAYRRVGAIMRSKRQCRN